MVRRGYVQLANGFYLNRKIRRLRRTMPSAVGAFVIMLSYCGDNLTDGYVDSDTAEFVLDITTQEFDALQQAGLTESVDGGYIIHDYLEHNRSRQQVIAKRKRERERYSAESLPAESAQTAGRIETESGQTPEHQNTRTSEHQEKEEEFHSSSKESENLTADDWAHTDMGADAISRIRGQYPKLDMRDALQAFTTHHGQTMKPPGMWMRLFQGWCGKRASIAQVPEQHKHTHTWACEHTLTILGLTDRSQVDDETMPKACRIANQLNEKENQS